MRGPRKPRPVPFWCLSFTGSDERVRGVVIVSGRNPVDAVRSMEALGIDPGGEGVVFEIPPTVWIPPELRYRLLTRAEAEAITDFDDWKDVEMINKAE